MTLLACSPLAKKTFEKDGLPLDGGFVYTYVAQTQTPKDTYKDALAIAKNSNPIVLDSQGSCDIYLKYNEGYKYVIFDKNHTEIDTMDNIYVLSSESGGDLTDINNAIDTLQNQINSLSNLQNNLNIITSALDTNTQNDVITKNLLNTLSTNLSNTSSSLSSLITTIPTSNANPFSFFISRGALKTNVVDLQYNNLGTTTTTMKNLLRFYLTPTTSFGYNDLNKIKILLSVDMFVEYYLISDTTKTPTATAWYNGVSQQNILVRNISSLNISTVYASSSIIVQANNGYSNSGATAFLRGTPSTFGIANGATQDISRFIFCKDPDDFSSSGQQQFAGLKIAMPYSTNTSYSGTAYLRLNITHNCPNNVYITNIASDPTGNTFVLLP